MDRWVGPRRGDLRGEVWGEELVVVDESVVKRSLLGILDARWMSQW